MNVQLEKLPAGVFYESVTKREKPIIFYLDSPWTPDPGHATFLYFNDKSYVDYSNYSNPRVNELIEGGLRTLDDNERKATYGQVQKILMDEAPWGFIAYPKYALARKAQAERVHLLHVEQSAVPGFWPKLRGPWAASPRRGERRGSRRCFR